MVGKIKAALDARHSRETLVIARTDAIAVEGFEHAVARAVSYRDAGADILFVEAPKTRAELERIPPAINDVPLMANMVEGGKTPPLRRRICKRSAFRSSFSRWHRPRIGAHCNRIFTLRLPPMAQPNRSVNACMTLRPSMTSSGHRN